MTAQLLVQNDNNVVLMGYQLSVSGVAVTDAEASFTVYEYAGPGATPTIAVPGLSRITMTYLSSAAVYSGLIPGTAALTPGSQYFIVVTFNNYNDTFADWFRAAARTSTTG